MVGGNWAALDILFVKTYSYSAFVAFLADTVGKVSSTIYSWGGITGADATVASMNCYLVEDFLFFEPVFTVHVNNLFLSTLIHLVLLGWKVWWESSFMSSMMVKEEQRCERAIAVQQKNTGKENDLIMLFYLNIIIW